MKNKKILYSVIAIVIVITSVFLINNKINKGKETIEAETITKEPIINAEKEKDTNKANFDLINLGNKEDSKEEPKIINLADIPVVPEPEMEETEEPEVIETKTEITDTTEEVEIEKVVEVEEVVEVVEVPEIEEVEEVKLTPAPKKEDTKKEEPKKETPKKETPKKEEKKPTPEPTKAPEPVKEEVKPNKNNKTEVLGVEIIGAGSFTTKEWANGYDDLFELKDVVMDELREIKGKDTSANGLFIGDNAITMNIVGSNANSITLQKDKENNTYKLTFKVSLKTADDEYKNNIANLNRAVLKAMMYKVSNYGEELYEAILDSWSGDEIYGIDTDKWVKINDVEVQYVKGGSYIIRKAQ